MSSVLSQKPRGHGKRFEKGVSGHPGGRRTDEFKALQGEFRKRLPDILDAFDRAHALDPPTLLTARYSEIGLAYAVGKPATIVKVEGDIDIRVSDEMRRARARIERMVLEGVAQVVEEREKLEHLEHLEQDGK